MICEPGRCSYALPADFFDVYDHPRLETAPREHFPGSYMVMLLRLSPAEMDKMRKKDRPTAEQGVAWARPHYYALMTHEEFVIWPPPDKPYVIHVRYFPQPQVW